MEDGPARPGQRSFPCAASAPTCLLSWAKGSFPGSGADASAWSPFVLSSPLPWVSCWQRAAWHGCPGWCGGPGAASRDGLQPRCSIRRTRPSGHRAPLGPESGCVNAQTPRTSRSFTSRQSLQF